jgi:hypothetical protein
VGQLYKNPTKHSKQMKKLYIKTQWKIFKAYYKPKRILPSQNPKQKFTKKNKPKTKTLYYEDLVFGSRVGWGLEFW